MLDHEQLPKSFLINGILIPALGFGTFQSDGNNSRVKEVVLQALKCGYRRIDTADAYGNEKEVGQSIKDSGIPRGQIFVTTKLAQTWHHPRDVEEALDASLKNLQLEYVPHAYVAGPNHTTVRHENNKVATIRPAVNQVELHPYLPQNELLAFCAEQNIHVTAHQPLGGTPVAAVNTNADKAVLKIAQETGYSPAQILIAWGLGRGTSLIPKTVNPSHMRENLDVVTLDQEQIARIERIVEVEGVVRFLDPSGHIGFDIFSELVDEPSL